MEREFAESQQFIQQEYVDDDNYSDSPSFANETESDYDVTSLQPLLTDDIIADLLQHIDTAQGDLHRQEQAQKMRALQHTAYIRQMKQKEIVDTATSFVSQISTDTVLRIAQAAITGPTVDPTYIYIISRLSVSHRVQNQKYESLVLLFLNSLTPLLYKDSPISFVLNTLLQAKYNLLNTLPTHAATSPSEVMNLHGKPRNT
jgi:hypothetical protein